MPASVYMMKSILRVLITPRLLAEDDRRRERILNILLLGLVTIATIATVVFFIFRVSYANNPDLSAGSDSPYIILFITALFWFLLILSRIGYAQLTGYLFVGLLFYTSMHTAYTFGIDVPQGMLMYALTIIVSGVVIGSGFSLVTLGLLVAGLLLLSVLQMNAVIIPNTARWHTPLLPGDVVAYVSRWGSLPPLPGFQTPK